MWQTKVPWGQTHLCVQFEQVLSLAFLFLTENLLKDSYNQSEITNCNSLLLLSFLLLSFAFMFTREFRDVIYDVTFGKSCLVKRNCYF